MGSRWPEALRRRHAAEARRTYARLLVEHERVRRVVARGGAGARACAPGFLAWRTLCEVAMFAAVGRRAALAGFCGRFCAGEAAGAEAPPRAVPAGAYLEALRAALELTGDGIVRHGGEPPWGKGQPRAPRSAEAFEGVCRALRDSDSDADELGSLAAILDGAETLPEAAEPGAVHRVAFDVPGKVLYVDDWQIALPEGLEYGFLRALLARREAGEVTPVIEQKVNWKNAVDGLRRRIRKATGRSLLGHVVVTAKGPPGGYRLHPGVEALHNREVRLAFLEEAALEGAAHRPRRRPKGRDLREGEEDD